MSKTILFLLCLLPTAVLAIGSVGKVADNLMEPVFILADLLGTISITIGISFIFAAFIKYMQYRVNPLATPISTPILLLIMGVVLVLLPWAYTLTESGVPVHL